MTIWFDMDGTIADLYGVDGWLDNLINEDTRPYDIAKPLVNMAYLSRSRCFFRYCASSILMMLSSICRDRGSLSIINTFFSMLSSFAKDPKRKVKTRQSGCLPDLYSDGRESRPYSGPSGMHGHPQGKGDSLVFCAGQCFFSSLAVSRTASLIWSPERSLPSSLMLPSSSSRRMCVVVTSFTTSFSMRK